MEKMVIEEIHKEMGILFKKYEIPALTLRLKVEILHEWSKNTAIRLKLDQDIIRKSIDEIFWATSQAQLALGYALLSKQSVKSPRGIRGVAYHTKDIPSMGGLSEIHTWHHLYCCIECIYRCWERLAIILKKVCYPDLSEDDSRRLYFDGIVKKISVDNKYNSSCHLKNLQDQIKNWNKVASLKNKVSHGCSSPLQHIKIGGELVDLYGPAGEPIIKFPYSSPNLIEEIKKLKINI